MEGWLMVYRTLKKVSWFTPFKITTPKRENIVEEQLSLNLNCCCYLEVAVKFQLEIYGKSTKIELSISLENHTTLFKTEVLATLECTQLYMTGTFANEHIIIISDNEAAIKTISLHEFLPLFMWQCYQNLVKLLTFNQWRCYGCLVIEDFRVVKGLINWKGKRLGPFIGPEHDYLYVNFKKMMSKNRDP